jgi:hypothetical protein
MWPVSRQKASVSEEVTRSRPVSRWSRPTISRSSAAASVSIRSAAAAVRSPAGVGA